MATQERREEDTGGGVSHLIKRPRLTKILDESEARIILLCAPAGYGKTTLAREWVATRREQVLWYSGGPAMADVAALAVDLAELFAGPESELVEKVRFLAARGEGPRALARALIRGVPESPHRTLIAIDDYQYVGASAEGEELLREAVSQSECRFLITSRRRPRWLEPRRVVYGSALVIGARDLAFTLGETSSLIPDAADVQRVADGWPVLISLAAARGCDAMSIDAPPAELFDFFAADLLASASSDLQHALLTLAAAGEVDAEITRTLIGTNAEAAIAEASALGFLPPETSHRIVMHPLLRQFLFKTFAELSPIVLEATARDVQDLLVRLRRWDQCLDLLESVPDDFVATTALEACLVELLDSGRIATVRRWVEYAQARDLDEPVFVLADAELAIRAGEGETGRILAKFASDRLQERLKARAHLASARAAHMCGQPAEVVEQTAQAVASTRDELIQREALWLAFLSTYEQQDEATEEHLARLCALNVDDADFALRVASARGVVKYETGHVEEALAISREAEALFTRARNPLIRTNQLNLLAHCLLVTSQYKDAIDVSEFEIEEARGSGVGFVVAYALVTRASSEIGMRRLRAARSTIAELRRVAPKPDSHVLGNIGIVEAKLAVATGNLARAAEALAVAPNSNVPPGFIGEILACRGLIQAAHGDIERARDTIAESERASRYVDSVAARCVAEAILLVQQDAGAEAVGECMEHVIRLGHRDMIVTGCRAFPRLAAICAQRDDLRAFLAELFAISRDVDLARAAGIAIPRAQRRGDSLSAREREILELLSEGRTNRQIAKTLFISESTTKVHVRHIFEKLGVHTRVEAAAVLDQID